MKKNYNHKQARWLLVVATLLALFVARPVKAEDNVYWRRLFIEVYRY